MTSQDLADKFTARLCDVLTADEMRQVAERNAAEGHPNVCHSHDFCDPNQVMLDVLDLCGIEYDPQDERQAEMISAAWSLSQKKWAIAYA